MSIITLVHTGVVLGLITLTSCTYKDEGDVRLTSGEYEDAIKAYDEAIKDNPKYADAYNNRGLAYAGLGEYNKAIADFDEAIQLDPLVSVYYYNHGASHYELGRHEQAIRDFDKALEISPQLADAYNSRGLAYQAQGMYLRAIEDYEESIKLVDAAIRYERMGDELGRRSAPYLNRGLAYYHLGQYEQALEGLEQAIVLNPTNADSYAVRAIVHTRISNHNLASQDIQQALALGYDSTELNKLVEQAKQ